MSTTNSHGWLDHGDDSGGITRPDPAAVSAGHEPDKFPVKPIFAVPASVVVAVVVAVGCALGVFAYFATRPSDPQAHPAAVKQNAEPLNERFDRIDRGNTKGVDQPRLEQLRQRVNNGQFTTQDEIPGGTNPPILHADHVRPSKERNPELFRSGPAGPAGVNRVPLDAVINAAGNPDARNALFPVRKDPVKVSPESKAEYPAAGRIEPPAPPKDEMKKDDGKKDEKK